MGCVPDGVCQFENRADEFAPPCIPIQSKQSANVAITHQKRITRPRAAVSYLLRSRLISASSSFTRLCNASASDGPL
jgi:hypothetical protein